MRPGCTIDAAAYRAVLGGCAASSSRYLTRSASSAACDARTAASSAATWRCVCSVRACTRRAAYTLLARSLAGDTCTTSGVGSGTRTVHTSSGASPSASSSGVSGSDRASDTPAQCSTTRSAHAAAASPAPAALGARWGDGTWAIHHGARRACAPTLRTTPMCTPVPSASTLAVYEAPCECTRTLCAVAMVPAHATCAPKKFGGCSLPRWCA